MEFNRRRFRNVNSGKLYEEVIKHEEITEFKVFDYASLDQDGLDLFTNFMKASVLRFCGFSYNF